jgi:hypothetical protein
MSDQERYPYRCDYMSCLLKQTKLDGRDILNITNDMMVWLYSIPHHWSTGYDTTAIWIIDHTAALAGGYGPRGHWMDMATYISFTYAEDLLAFRLAWGIHA